MEMGPCCMETTQGLPDDPPFVTLLFAVDVKEPPLTATATAFAMPAMSSLSSRPLLPFFPFPFLSLTLFVRSSSCDPATSSKIGSLPIFQPPVAVYYCSLPLQCPGWLPPLGLLGASIHVHSLPVTSSGSPPSPSTAGCPPASPAPHWEHSARDTDRELPLPAVVRRTLQNAPSALPCWRSHRAPLQRPT